MVGTQLRGLPVSLVGRRRVVRRRRRVLRMRGWLGTGFIACFSLTLFAVTFFSLLGR
jgi:hypothetical protein